MNRFYILDSNKIPIPASLAEWAQTYTDNLVLEETLMPNGDRIITYFLGILPPDSSHQDRLFTTCVLNSQGEANQIIYTATWDETMAAHQRLWNTLSNAAKPLTKRQKQVWRVVSRYVTKKGYHPPLDELAIILRKKELVPNAVKTHAQYYVDLFAKKGLLSKPWGY